MDLKFIHKLKFFIFLFVLIFLSGCKSVESVAEFKIVAYQKYNTINRFEPNAYKYIDQLIYKLIRVNADGSLELLPSTLADLSILKKSKIGYGKVKLLIGVGGAKANSEHFSEMASKEASREQFAQNLLRFCLGNDLDGADIDWEYPKSRQDQENALKMFRILHKKFNGHNLILTGAFNYKSDQVRFAKTVEPFVNQIHLMAYEPIEGLDTFKAQLEYAYAQIENKNLSREKLLIGLPFYGRSLKDKKTIPYYLAPKNVKKGMSDEQWDLMTTTAIKKSTLKAMSNKLNGVMFWELGFDDQINLKNSLLKTIYNSTKNEGHE